VAAMDVPIAVVSSRPALDLAINTWVPGYLASVADDVDAVIDVTRTGGVVIVDLAAAEHAPLLDELRARAADSRIVAMVPEGTVVADGLADRVVASTVTIGELREAIEGAALVERPARTTRPAVDPAAAEATDPTPSEVSRARPDDTGTAQGDERRRGDRGGARRSRRWLVRRRAEAPTSAQTSVEHRDSAPAAEAARGPATIDLALAPLFGDRETATDRGAAPSERPSGSPTGAPTEPPPPPPAQVSLGPSLDRETAPAAWSILERLAPVISDGSAMVGVRLDASRFAVVAATGIAPLEAANGLPGHHALLDAADAGGGIVTIPEVAYGSVPLGGMPFEGCPTIIAARTTLGPDVDALVLLTRSRPFSEDDGDIVRRVLDESRIASTSDAAGGWSISSAAVTAPATVQPLPISSAWRLLDQLYPHLGDGAAAVALRTVEPGFAITAGARIELSDGTLPVRLPDALWQRFASTGGRLLVRPRELDDPEVADLPLRYHLHLAVLALGPVEGPDGLVFLGRTAPFEAADLATIHRVLAGPG
jgi:hypothetical protein